MKKIHYQNAKELNIRKLRISEKNFRSFFELYRFCYEFKVSEAHDLKYQLSNETRESRISKRILFRLTFIYPNDLTLIIVCPNGNSIKYLLLIRSKI